MSNVVILFAPEKSPVKEQAKAVADAISSKEWKVSIKSAAKSHIPELAPADIMIFGSGDTKIPASEGEYKELFRAFEGVNFAGKIAAVFSETGSSFDSELVKTLEDSDAALFQPVLSFSGSQINKKTMTDWVKKLFAFFKEYRSTRNV
ncbi:MAG: hypothetical protein EHM28_08670 [Spirochaetaceae bacterium]|nr:MAG: hypothetical protein EHM28_08670 [Spirochaetaceae bacterium]